MEKIKFPEIPKAGIEEDKTYEQKFLESYNEYRKVKELLDTPGGDKDDLSVKFDEARESIAQTIVSIYKESKSLEEFEDKIKDLINENEDIWVEEINNYINSLYGHPFKLKSEDRPSPVEAIWATIENIKTVSEFVKFGEKADGIILSGSNSYGPFYTPRGRQINTIVEANIEQVNSPESLSDVDLLINCEDISQLKEIVEDYVKAGLFPPSEKERFNAFKDIFDKGEIDSFSVLSKHKNGTEAMIHFVFNKDIEKFADSREKGLGFLRDLRPKVPKSVATKGYYPVFDLVTVKLNKFSIEPEVVNYKDGSGIAGYISKTPTGGVEFEEDDKAYYLGHINKTKR